MEPAKVPRAEPVRVLIADDDPMLIESIETLLRGDARVQVIGTASNGQDAVDLARALAPDVTLLDIAMPVLDGLEAARRIRLDHPNACVLILTGSKPRRTSTAPCRSRRLPDQGPHRNAARRGHPRVAGS
jgi:DNA-binding NarL/FixJ family response regulator